MRWKNIRKNKEIAVFILFLIIGLAIYANSFGNQFFWDDNDEIVNNVYVQHFDVGKMFSQSMISGAGQTTNYYRPILLLSYALDYQLWGMNSFGFNLADVLLHILNAWLIFILLYFLLSLRPTTPQPLFRKEGSQLSPHPSFGRRGVWLAFLPALIFLIHPLNTEAVDYVSGRADVLYAFFLLLSLIFWLRQSLTRRTLPFDRRSQIINYSAAAAFFILSLLTKETAVVLPFLVLLIELIFISAKSPGQETLPGLKKLKTVLKKTWLLFAILAVYLILHFTVFNFNQINGSLIGCLGAYCDYNIFQRGLVFLLVCLNYFKILFLPLGLHMERAVAEFGSIYSWKILAAAAAILLWAAAAVFFWKKEKGIAFGFFWFFILLAPTSGIAVKMIYPTYEHFLYLPMIGFWLAVFCLIDILFAKIKPAGVLRLVKFFFYVMLTACVVYWSILTIRHNRLWHDPLTFYENNLKYSPQSFIEHANLGMAYDDVARYQDAIAEYQKAIAIADLYPQVHFDLANSLVAVKNYTEAEKEYLRAISMDPGFISPYRNLYSLYVYLGEKDKAEEINKISNNK
ncbi:MAG TPA: tetratricopeptide repeat protein [Candidatus Nanoarchaeia archaeon]|nr:tetratricopeptide repeat protein [Candidatus Nanoarchaeia archaeon]